VMSPENDVSQFRCTSVPVYLPSFAEHGFGCSSSLRNSQQNLGKDSQFSYGESRANTQDESLSPLLFSRQLVVVGCHRRRSVSDECSDTDVTVLGHHRRCVVRVDVHRATPLWKMSVLHYEG